MHAFAPSDDIVGAGNKTQKSHGYVFFFLKLLAL